MNNEVEDVQSTSVGNGLFTIPNSVRPISKKVYDLFTKLKKKTDEIEAPTQSSEPNLAELQQEAMNSYRLQDEVIKTERGFEIV